MLNDSFVSYPPRIYSLLKQSLKYRHQVSVYLKQRPDVYTSCFVSIDTQFNYILLDELFPEQGNMRATAGELLTIENSLNHVPLRFDSVILENQSIQQSIPDCLAIKFPAEIYYPQNRHYHRVNISRNDQVESRLLLENTTVIQAEVYDLSITGICLSFPAGNQSNFPVTVGKIYDLSLRLGSFDEISLEINIQNQRVLPQSNQVLFGADFINITRLAQNHVQKYITEKERHSLLKNR